jgi:hypothetical protein
MEFVEVPSAMSPASSQARAIIGPVFADKLNVGGIAVHLENAAVTAEMSANALSGSAVLEAIATVVAYRN